MDDSINIQSRAAVEAEPAVPEAFDCRAYFRHSLEQTLAEFWMVVIGRPPAGEPVCPPPVNPCPHP